MSSTAKWTDTEGINTLKKIVLHHISQWLNGLYDFQLENISCVLDGDKLLVFTATGDGKSSLYNVPLLVHLELAANLELCPPFPIRKNRIVVVVTPTKGWAKSIIHEAKEFGLSGLSYCHEHITEYTAKKINLVKSICECKEWQLICVDPEHLATPKWQEILKSNVFLKNLLLFCIEEVHLICSWGPGFCPHFESIGAIARGFIPEQMYHSLCMDEYNRETFELVDNDLKLQVVIATVAFMQGIKRKPILDSILFNFPTTLDEFWQAKRRAGQSPDNAKDFMRAHHELSTSTTHKTTPSKNKKLKKQDAEDVVDMDQGKASFLAKELCLTGNINKYYVSSTVDLCIRSNEASVIDLSDTQAIRSHVHMEARGICLRVDYAR
ncbi:hypothetical protein K435DRAFT_795347 [Dendrothele bispora CBS 962.96]|uniref:DNA 3'-5' helicase n=1 Tax=Dendrothele bispora (strain CBS 962.96) TaxID=1314807 RepID=A0A4S8L349_DENBC|nr:hypothetical protein K435DRAFT_807889 [Dendrothele bispora CBS 962.96]THU98945.1 hypothetical protein K435DRAFT_795347 [Dendrothele bispora CBS 962.96]